MSDVDIIIGADASKLNRELRQAQDEFDRLTRAQARAGDAAGRLDGAVDGARRRLEAVSAAAHRAGVSIDKAEGPVIDMDRGMARLAKGAALTGGAFGSLAGPIGDVGDAFAMMPAPAAAATVALASVVAVGYGLASAAVEAARSAEELSDTLGPMKANALAAGDALTAMDRATRESYLTVGALFSPAVEEAAYVVTGLAREARDAAAWLGLNSGGLGSALSAAASLASMLDSRIWLVLTGLRMLRSSGAEIEETVSTDPDKLTAEEAARKKAHDELMASLDLAATNNRLDQMNRERDEAAKLQDQMRQDAEKAAAERSRIAEQQAREAEQYARDLDADTARFGVGIAAAMEASAQAAQTHQEEMDGFGVSIAAQLDQAGASWEDYSATVEQGAIDTMTATQRMQQDIGQVGNAVGQFANFAVNLTNSVVSLVETIQTNSGNRSREALRKQFAARKAAAIAEATVNTALAATQALSTPPIAVGIVLMALALAAGGVQIANIAAQKPSFHRGGVYRSGDMAPDERDVSVRARANEAMFMTNQAIGAWASQIARLNTGQGAAAEGSRVVVMMDGPRQTRGFARPDPGYGHAMIGGA